MMYFHMIWSAPLQIALAMYLLWQVLGVSSLAGLGVMVLMIPLNGWIARKTRKLQVKQMAQKDSRIKEVNEVCTLLIATLVQNSLAVSFRFSMESR